MRKAQLRKVDHGKTRQHVVCTNSTYRCECNEGLEVGEIKVTGEAVTLSHEKRS